jgi:hypothetical protein
MARKNTAPAVKPASQASKGEARKDLLDRAARNAEGACHYRSDPLADAKSGRTVVEAAKEHAAELQRRGLPAAYGEAALEFAREIEGYLVALPAAAVTARGRSPEMADLIADAAATAHAVREAVLRVSRGPEGRRVARDFGLGDPFSARLQGHVLRALQKILAAMKSHPKVAADIGLLPEDVQIMQGLADDLGRLPGAGAPLSDEQAKLLEAQGALRAFFDLLAAKVSLALAGDPDERARMLSLIPRAEDRRHLRRQPERASG